MIGIYTRTRSQIHQSSFSHDDAELRCLIKDLRTRRVFSPKSIHADQNVGSVYMGSHGICSSVTCGGEYEGYKHGFVFD
jgi:hypothetical protein